MRDRTLRISSQCFSVNGCEGTNDKTQSALSPCATEPDAGLIDTSDDVCRD